MGASQGPRSDPPIRHRLLPVYVLSALIAVLMATASGAGLLCSTLTYPTEELRQSFVSNDAVNLVMGLPILLGSAWLAGRGRLIGLLCWPGALFFVLYSYLVYLFAMPFGVAFLLHLALVMLSTYATMALVASIDAEAVRTRLVGAVPERLAGGILAGLGLLFFLRVVGVAVDALARGTPMPDVLLAVHTADVLICPAWIIGGTLLWRRNALGYVAALGLLFQASMLFIGLIAFLLIRPFLTGGPSAPIDVAVILIMGSVCFVPFVLFARGVVRGPGARLKPAPRDPNPSS